MMDTTKGRGYNPIPNVMPSQHATQYNPIGEEKRGKTLHMAR